ncbi:MAG: CYTH domain-containing protein [Gammaproteobacteria bacterium]|nr:CYTH domain-containing protein [Gammaproteobacteria bacterium]
MPVEIERKFLIRNDNWKSAVDSSTPIRQGYLAPLSKASMRIRIDGDKANINIKSATLGIHRMEYEYPIPMDEALEMLDQLCDRPQIEKVRHRIKQGKHVWEIDEFAAENAGLIMAEIELESEDEAFDKPDWLGEEVTGDERYYNVNMVRHPYKDWC